MQAWLLKTQLVTEIQMSYKYMCLPRATIEHLPFDLLQLSRHKLCRNRVLSSPFFWHLDRGTPERKKHLQKSS